MTYSEIIKAIEILNFILADNEWSISVDDRLMIKTKILDLIRSL